MRRSVNRMALCKILVPFIKENLEFQPTGDLARDKNKGAGSLFSNESSNPGTQCSSFTLLEELVLMKFIRYLNSNHSWDNLESIFLKSSIKRAMLTKRSINYYRILGNNRENLRLEEQSCSLHKPQQQCLALTMKPGCNTLLKEYMKVNVKTLVTQSCLTLRSHRL